MLTLNISQADIVTANYERIDNPIRKIRKRMEAEESKRIMNKTIYNNNIVTEITKFDEFYLAEEYHQKYLKKLGKY